MNVYVVVVQGRFVDVFLKQSDAEALRDRLYMGGSDGATIIHRII